MTDADYSHLKDLNQLSENDYNVLQSLNEISKIERVTVRHANFRTGVLKIVINSIEPSFKGVMDGVAFCAITKRMKVISVDFTTGEIEVVWLPDLVHNLAPDEIDYIKSGQKIKAIKLVRGRLGVGLATAKTMVEKHWDEIRGES